MAPSQRLSFAADRINQKGLSTGNGDGIDMSLVVADPRSRIQAAGMALEIHVAFKAHPVLLGYADGRNIAGINQGDHAVKSEVAERVLL